MRDGFADSMEQGFGRLGFSAVGSLKDLDGIPAEKGGKLCLGLECLDRDLWEYAPAAPLIRGLGIHRARLQSGWQKTERREGVYDHAWLDSVVDSLLEAKIEPFLCLCYGNRLYCGDPGRYPDIANGGIGHFPVETARERAAWQGYVRATVAHFRGRIRDYEVWNEPDISVFCRTEMPWQDAYMELLRLTAPVIRETDPGARVISCTAEFSCAAALIEKGLGRYADIHSFHGYSFYPETDPVDSRNNRIGHYRKLAPGLAIWRGEAGCPSWNDPKSRGALSDIRASETKQAKFLLRHLLCDMECGGIELTSYFHAYDFMHFSGSCRYHYGLIRHEGLSRKPSYGCLQVLAHLFDGTTEAARDALPSFARDGDGDLSPMEKLALRFAAFRKHGREFYAYYLPLPIEDDAVARRVCLTLPASCPDGAVILDPYTRRVYGIPDPFEFDAPLTDYPLFIVGREQMSAMADLPASAAAPVRRAAPGQRDHE